MSENLYFTHKTLRLCLALDPKNFGSEVKNSRDFSSYKKHSVTPLAILLKSNKSVENANMLIFTMLSNKIV